MKYRKRFYVFVAFWGLATFQCSKLLSQESIWQQSKGLDYGPIYSLAIDSEGTILAASGQPFVYRSRDNGDTWEEQLLYSFGLSFPEVLSLAVNSRDHIFAVTLLDGAYRSTDNGENWEELNIRLEFTPFTAVAISKQGNVFIGSGTAGIFRSLDNGDNWTQFGSEAGVITALAVNPSGAIFAGTLGDGLLRSTNNGENWVVVNSGLLNLNVYALTVGNGGAVYAGTAAGVFRSLDNGDTWEQAGLSDYSVTAFTPDSSGRVFAGTGDHIFTTDVEPAGIFRTMDRGQTWTQVNSGLFNKSVGSLAASPSGDIFAGTDSTGIFRSSDDGESWQKAGTLVILVLCFAETSKGNLLAGTSLGVFSSPDQGETWAQSGLDNTIVLSLIRIDLFGLLYAGTSRGIFRSADGINWLQLQDFPDNFVWSLAVEKRSPSVEIIYAGTRDNGIYRSQDFGASWEQVLTLDNIVFSLFVNSKGHIFAGTDNMGVYRSSDSGTSWSQFNTGITNLDIWSFAANSNGDIFAGSRRGRVFRSMDDGEKWTELNVGASGTIISLVIQNDLVFAGTGSTDDAGVLHSTNNGDTWTVVGNDLQHKNVWSLFVDADGVLFAGTQWGGVYRYDDVVTAVAEIRNEMASSYLLAQNYPNPFNPTTTIQFSLPKPGPVNLKVYNTLGEEVAGLVNGYFPSGDHKISWNASGLASGVYYYQLQAESFIMTKKLLFVK